MRIPDSIIDDIRNASDIVDIISLYVPLKKRGKNYTGLCPFHQEKTPSFSVSAEKQMYYCFGCARGGNVFTFIMEHDKVSFVEAARTLANRAGIAIPEERPEDSVQATENERLFAACRTSADIFSQNLTSSVEGKMALEYFKHRGFTPETIRRFGLGYSMNAWDALAKHVERSKLDPEVFEKAGLIMRREDGSGFYDRFRGRAMFPIYSTSGRVIAFGARKLREDDPMGKYINSPETPIYDKGRTLYGLFQAREAIRAREYCILVEGYADLISVSQSGIENIVASSGTALTEGQIQLIGRHAKTITLVYDADSAGSKAALRGVDLIIESGLDVRVAQLPQGEDPDSFIRKEGGEAFQRLLDGAVSFLDFKMQFFREQGLLTTPEGTTKAIRSLVETLARMKDELKRTLFLKSIAEKYDIYESVLYRELEKNLGREAVRARAEERRDADRQVPSTDVPAPNASGPVPAPERDLLKVMLEHKAEAISFVFSHIGLEHFTHPLVRKAAQMLMDRPDDSWDATTLIDEVDDPALKGLIAGLLATRYEISKQWAAMGSEPEGGEPRKIAEDAILRLKTSQLDRQIEERYRRMKEADARGKSTGEIQQELIDLQKEKLRLHTHRLG